MYNIIDLPDSKISHIGEGISAPLADKIPKQGFFQQFWEKAPGQNWGKMIRVLTRILKIELKMLFARKKKMEFYHTFLLALLKMLESESKSWSKIIQIWS